jgi:hypothetical protein
MRKSVVLIIREETPLKLNIEIAKDISFIAKPETI